VGESNGSPNGTGSIDSRKCLGAPFNDFWEEGSTIVPAAVYNSMTAAGKPIDLPRLALKR
jgi:hypothetical protein